MQRVLLAPRAVLLDLHAIRHVGLVLGGRVITTLAISASQGNHSAHVSKPPFTAPTGTVANITIDHHVMSMPTVLPYLFCKRDSQLERNSEEKAIKGSADTGMPPCQANHERKGWQKKDPAPIVAPGPTSTPRSAGNRSYSMMVETIPEPTVWPPSRIAKRRPSSMAIGWMSSPVMVMWSPGMAISVPSGRRTEPVTSVVRK